jgi:hypothetical protein
MAIQIFMKKIGDTNRSAPDNQKYKVDPKFAQFAKDANVDYPVLKDSEYNILKQRIIKLYFDENFNFKLLGAPVSDKQATLDNVENGFRSSIGAFEKGNTESQETAQDLQKARESGEKKVDEFYSDLKSNFKQYFTGDIEKDKPNFIKLNQAVYSVNSWYQKDPKWKTTVSNALGVGDENVQVAHLCQGEVYNIEQVVDSEGTKVATQTRLKAEISLVNSIKNVDGTVEISQGGKKIKLQEIIDNLSKDGSRCYKIIEGIENILSFEGVEQLPLITDAIESNPDQAVPSGPSPEEAAAESKKTREAARQIFGNFDKFDQQCILLKLIDKITSLSKLADGTKQDYENLVTLEAQNINEARIITNLINGSKQFKPFVNIPNHVVSSLIPKIKLIKSYLREDNSQIDIEIPMEEFVNPEDILAENIVRGFGYGLKTFSWENTSFNEVDRNIDAHLVLRFSNMDSFVKFRKGNIIGLEKAPPPDIEKYQNFKFLDLIYQAPPNASAEGLLPNKFHIKIAVGWQFNDNILADLVENKTELEELKKAIKANETIFYLFNKGHDLSFEKDGSVTVDINYQSAQEARMNDEQYSNVLNILDAVKLKRLQELKKQTETLQADLAVDQSEDKKTELSEGLQKALDDQTTLETEINSDIHRLFILELYKRRAVKLSAISGADLIKLKTSLTPLKDSARPNVRRLTDLEKQIYEESKAADLEGIKAQLITRVTEKNEKIIPYFNFGDLLSLVITIVNRDKAEKIKLATGPYIYQKFISEDLKKENKLKNFGDFKDKLTIINIADIPISMDFFIYWFEEEIIKKGRRTYTIRNFLSNVLNKFIIQVLRPACFGKSFAIGNYKLDIHLLNVIAKNGSDPLSGTPFNQLGTVRRQIKDLTGLLDQSINFLNSERLHTIPYLYIQLMYVNEDKMEANEDLNIMQGIYHLRLGAEKGLVKEINFAKDDNKFIAPAIYAQQGVVTPGVLSVPYNAEIVMIGNTIFKPGSIVYIDPSFTLSTPSLKGPGTKVIDEMRLGGFYLITRTRNVIEPGKFGTTLSCRWIAQGRRT